MAGPSQCFISYSHVDHSGFERLLANLKPVVYSFEFKLWHDRRIKPGYYWNDVIKTEIENSNLFVLLITNDFFASDYIRQHELPAMIERHEKHGALMIPVIYRNSCWRSYFGNFIEVVPKNSKNNLVPVCTWSDREDALAVATNAISTSIADWFGVKPRSIFSLPATLPAGGVP